MRFIIAHQTFTDGDDVGHDIIGQHETLKGLGFEVTVFAENYLHSAHQYKTKDINFKKILSDEDNILIYHHSIYWKLGKQLLDKFRGKIVVKYHSITPPEFFKQYSNKYYEFTEKGIEQTKRIAKMKKINLFLGDSGYNCKELEKYGVANDLLRVASPFNKIEEMKAIDVNEGLLTSLRTNGKINVLFIGRVVPNKGHKHIIKVAYSYKKYFDNNMALWIVGSLDTVLRDYTKELNNLANELNVNDVVHFTGEVSINHLKSYLLGSDIFLCLSEHEGFCMPLIEAQYFNLPVVAYNCPAVSETLGKNQIIFDKLNYDLIASAIDTVAKDKDTRECLIDHGYKNYLRFRNDSIKENFINILSKVILDKIDLKLPDRPRKKIKNIVVEGPFETSYSLAIVNRNLALAMDKLEECNVALSEGPDYIPREEDLNKYPEVKKLWLRYSKDFQKDFVIINTYPPRVNHIDGKHNLLWLAWEESLINKEWVEDFNKYLDGVMVVSNFVKDVFKNSGVNIPIAVVPNGVKNFEIEKVKPFNLDSKKSFRFLHISSGFPRKGIDVLLEAYFREFTDSDDVCLIIKTFPNIHNDIANRIATLKMYHKNHPEIIHIDEDLPREDVLGLYKISHCLVYPTRGEGFALPIAEAMLAKIPVIVTNYSGHTDFCNEETAFLVNYKLAPSCSHLALPGSKWAEPDIKDLKKKMRYVSDNRNSEEIKKCIKNAFDNISNHYTWHNSAIKCLNFLDFIERKKKIKLGMVTTWNTRCGIAEYSKYLFDCLNPKKLNIKILANEHGNLVNKDDNNVVRCWKSYLTGGIESLYQSILKQRLNIVHFQFNFGLFELDKFSILIKKLKEQNIRIIITFHSTTEVKTNGKCVSLKSIAEELKQVDIILVHTIEDTDRLNNYGIKHNIVLFPHGFIEYEDEDKNELRKFVGINNSKVIASVGFLLPHKGILETIRAVDILKRNYTDYADILYIVSCALYPELSSHSYLRQCQNEIKRLNLRNNVIINTQFLPKEEAISWLHLADMLVLCYGFTQESSSAAVRFAISSYRPVVVTKQNFFKDIEDESFQIENNGPALIAKSIDYLYKNEDLQKELVNKAKRRIKENSWDVICDKYIKILYELSSFTI